MSRMRLASVAFVATAGLCGCGGGSSPTSPSAPPVADRPSPAPTATPTPAPSPSATPAPAPSPTPPVSAVLRVARMRGVNGHAAAGTARILREGSQHVLEFGDDFRISGGVNDVYLAHDSKELGPSDLKLGNLIAVSGKQRYRMPDSGSGYAFVLVWCRPARIPIAAGELR